MEIKRKEKSKLFSSLFNSVQNWFPPPSYAQTEVALTMLLTLQIDLYPFYYSSSSASIKIQQSKCSRQKLLFNASLPGDIIIFQAASGWLSHLMISLEKTFYYLLCSYLVVSSLL